MHMKRVVIGLIALVASGAACSATFSANNGGLLGTSSTIGVTGDYSSLAAAVADLNNGPAVAADYTFYILNDIDEGSNIAIGKATNGFTVRLMPAAGVRPTILFTNTTTANTGYSGNLLVGIATIAATTPLVTTDRFVIDGSNAEGGVTRDLTIANCNPSVEGGVGVVRFLGGSTGCQVINSNIIQNSSSGTNTAAVQFTTLSSAPTNFTISNNSLQSLRQLNGAGILCNTGAPAPAAGVAQTGYVISNNLVYAAQRGINLSNNGSGIVTNNTIRINSAGGSTAVAYAISHSASNSVANYTIDITNNRCTQFYGLNATSVAGGVAAVWIANASNVAGTYNISNNMIGGFGFTNASLDGTYRGISVDSGTSSTTYNIEHNTINMTQSASISGATLGKVYAIGLGAMLSPAPVLNIRNNLIRFGPTAANAYAVYSPNTAIVAANVLRNCIAGGKTGAVNGSTYSTFSAWQTASFDAGGQSVDPASSGATGGGVWASSAANTIFDGHFLAAVPSVANCSATNISTDIDGDARTAASACIPGADQPANLTPAVYTWALPGGGVFDDPNNWSPVRSNPRWNDALVFDGAVSTTTQVTVSGVRDQTLGRLEIRNGARISFNGRGRNYTGFSLSNAQNLVILNGNNSSSDDLSVGAGSLLRLAGASSLTVDLIGGAVGTIAGDVNLDNTTQSVVQRITSKTQGGLVFTSGSTCSLSPGFSGLGSGFGGATADGFAGSWNGTAITTAGVVFQSGSTFHQGADKNGAVSGASGSSPFALTAPATLVTFLPGSTYINWSTLSPSASGRAYGSFVARMPGAGSGISGTGDLRCFTDLRIENSANGGGTFSNNLVGNIVVEGSLVVQSGNGIFNDSAALTGAANIEVRGDISIAGPSNFTPNTNAFRTFLLSGSGNQNVGFGNTTITNLNVANSATLTAGTTVTGTLALGSSILSTGANTITVDEASVTRSSGYVRGNLRFPTNLSTTGLRTFFVGDGSYSPVQVTITSPGSGVGLTASATASSLVSDAGAQLNRYWTVTPDAGASVGSNPTLNFSYADTDLAGGLTEGELIVGREVGVGIFERYAATTVDTANNLLTVTNVTGAGRFTAGRGSVVPVSVSGVEME